MYWATGKRKEEKYLIYIPIYTSIKNNKIPRNKYN